MIAIRCVVFSVTAIVQDSVKRVFKTRFIIIMFMYKTESKGCLKNTIMWFFVFQAKGSLRQSFDCHLVCCLLQVCHSVCTRQSQKGV